MRRVLLVAYHFPPLAGSSGIQRTLRFVQQLPEFGWQPLVLTTHARAYERCSPDLDAEVPAGTVVRRAFALDTARHLAVSGRYIGALARPDRWMTWRFDAVREGLRMIRTYRPNVIWSTYPIATAHVIGAELARRSGLPWVADFRDPMAQDGYPGDPKTWARFSEIEQSAMQHARVNVFTTPSAALMYGERYPFAASRIVVIENGYDEDSFPSADEDTRVPLNPGAITLLHSGIVYPSERDPTALFEALGQLKRAGKLVPGTVKLRFRATAHDGLLDALSVTHSVHDMIELLPPIPYREALKEMQRADGLLIMQGPGCNAQIPAKIYEYLRSRRPMLGLTDPTGDTAGVLRHAGITAIAQLGSAEEIARQLPAFINSVREGLAPLPSTASILAASRRSRTQALAHQMESISQSAA